jgi:hypothetical protein
MYTGILRLASGEAVFLSSGRMDARTILIFCLHKGATIMLTVLILLEKAVL